MRSVEEKAKAIDTMLSGGYLGYVARYLQDIGQHLHHATVVKQSVGLHKLIQKIILHNGKKDSSRFSIVNYCPRQDSDSLLKGATSAKRCHENLSFRLAHLERLLLQKRINSRTFKQLKALLVKTQFASNKSSKSMEAKVKHFKSLQTPLQDTFNDHVYK